MRKATISGRGPFPFDMLRHDLCHPSTTSDAQIMGSIPDYNHFTANVETWTLQVTTHKNTFTEARWNSFGVGIRIDD